MSTSTTREKQFLSLREQHHNREELFQHLNYNNGVHYSARTASKSIEDTGASSYT